MKIRVAYQREEAWKVRRIVDMLTQFMPVLRVQKIDCKDQYSHVYLATPRRRPSKKGNKT